MFNCLPNKNVVFYLAYACRNIFTASLELFNKAVEILRQTYAR